MKFILYFIKKLRYNIISLYIIQYYIGLKIDDFIGLVKKFFEETKKIYGAQKTTRDTKDEDKDVLGQKRKMY